MLKIGPIDKQVDGIYRKEHIIKGKGLLFK